MKGHFKSNDDLFTFAQRLADHARLLGDDAIITAIGDGLVSGATGSEQLGMFRSALSVCRPSIDERYPEDLRALLDEAIEEIDNAFRRANWRA